MEFGEKLFGIENERRKELDSKLKFLLQLSLAHVGVLVVVARNDSTVTSHGYYFFWFSIWCVLISISLISYIETMSKTALPNRAGVMRKYYLELKSWNLNEAKSRFDSWESDMWIEVANRASERNDDKVRYIRWSRALLIISAISTSIVMYGLFDQKFRVESKQMSTNKPPPPPPPPPGRDIRQFPPSQVPPPPPPRPQRD